MPEPVVEFWPLLVHPEEALTCPLVGHLILQVPDAISMCKLFMSCPHFRQYSTLKLCHGGQEVGVVLGVDRNIGTKVASLGMA